jgi:hypothetical protein
VRPSGTLSIVDGKYWFLFFLNDRMNRKFDEKEDRVTVLCQGNRFVDICYHC